MGYTHYFTVTGRNTSEWQTAWDQILKDAPLILEACHVPLTGDPYGGDDVTPPIVDDDKGIIFNGVFGDSHEPLYLTHEELTENNFCFVKTARKPYDLPVACVLLRLHQLAPKNFDLSSDGDWDEDEWKAARQLYKQLWPNDDIESPFRKAEGSE